MGRNTLEVGDLNPIPPGKWKDLSVDPLPQANLWTAKLLNKKRRKDLQIDFKKKMLVPQLLAQPRVPEFQPTGLEVSWTWYLPIF